MKTLESWTTPCFHVNTIETKGRLKKNQMINLRPTFTWIRHYNIKWAVVFKFMLSLNHQMKYFMPRDTNSKTNQRKVMLNPQMKNYTHNHKTMYQKRNLFYIRHYTVNTAWWLNQRVIYSQPNRVKLFIRMLATKSCNKRIRESSILSIRLIITFTIERKGHFPLGWEGFTCFPFSITMHNITT